MYNFDFLKLANENAKQVTRKRKMKRIRLIIWSVWVVFTVLCQYGMILQNGEWRIGGNVIGPLVALALIIINLYVKD